jgi:hypothetical protein
MSTADFRKIHQMAKLTAHFATNVCGEALGGTRLKTLIADGFWPLLAALHADPTQNLWLHWFHAYHGDLPESIPRLLRSLELTNRGAAPLCHGVAQGLLGWVWQEEERLQQTAAC